MGLKMKSKDNIKKYIIDEFLMSDDKIEIPYDLDLINSGIIDSLGVLKLIAQIERSNNIVIEDDYLDFEALKSIDLIYDYISQKLPQRG